MTIQYFAFLREPPVPALGRDDISHPRRDTWCGSRRPTPPFTLIDP